MKETVTFASSYRVKAALCCSVAVLLTACGGATDDVDSRQLPSALTASEIMEVPGAGTTTVVDAGASVAASVAQETSASDAAAGAVDSATAPVAPADASTPSDNGLAGAEGGVPAAGAAAASNEFNLSGYQDSATVSPSDATTQGATAVTSTDSQQAAQLPAA